MGRLLRFAQTLLLSACLAAPGQALAQNAAANVEAFFQGLPGSMAGLKTDGAEGGFVYYVGEDLDLAPQIIVHVSPLNPALDSLQNIKENAQEIFVAVSVDEVKSFSTKTYPGSDGLYVKFQEGNTQNPSGKPYFVAQGWIIDVNGLRIDVEAHARTAAEAAIQREAITSQIFQSVALSNWSERTSK